MDTFARVLVIGGIGLVLAGLLAWGAARLGLGRMPGDIAVERENVRVYVPIVSMILLSLLLTVILNIALRIWR